MRYNLSLFVVLIVLLSTATLAGACAPAPPGAPAGTGPSPEVTSAPTPSKYGGTLRFGAIRDATTYDPHKSGGISHSWLPGNIFDTLIEYDLDGNFTGALAESWEQPDATTYIFHLRKGVTFHDGSDLDAEDVLATFDRIKDPETAAQHAGIIAGLETIEAEDEFTVRVELKEPSATFLNTLADTSMWILSSDDVGKEFNTPEDYNGTGPFMLESWEPQRQYVLKKNPNYWQAGLPYLDELILMPITDERGRIDALRSHEVDVIEYVPWQAYEELQQEGFEIFKHHGLMTFIRLNHDRPPLDNKAFRQALAYIIDREEVNELAFGGQGRPMTGPLQPADSPFYFEELEGTYVKDWDKARALLKEAGFDSPADVPTLEYQVSVSAISATPAKVVQQQLQEFGLDVQYKTVDVPTLINNRNEGTYQLHHDGGGMSWPDPDYLRAIFHSEHGTVYATGVGYHNEQVDQLLEEGLRTTGTEERREIYRQVEENLLDDLPWIWVSWRVQAEAIDPEVVSGYESYPSALWKYNVARFENIWLER